MKTIKSFFAVFLLLMNIHFSFSQEKNENLILFSSTSAMNAETLGNLSDLLNRELTQDLTSIGYIVMYSGANPVENAFNRNFFRSFMRFQGLDPGRFLLLTTIGSNKPKFEFWISKDGTKPKIKEEDFSLSLPNDKSVHFVKVFVETVNTDGKQSLHNVGCHECTESLDLYLLSDFLKSNPQMKAHVIIHGKSFKQAKQVRDILARESLEDAKIPSNRLKFLFGGKNKINENYFIETKNDFSEVEVYIASDDSQLPKPTSIKHRPL